MRLIINTDGGARGNPGIGAASFIVANNSGEILFEKGEFIPQTTNNNAEYRGVQMAIQWLEREGEKYSPDSADFFIDSELVVKQLNGIYKIKDSNLRALASSILETRSKLPFSISFTHVRREQNKLADTLVNSTIDSQHV